MSDVVSTAQSITTPLPDRGRLNLIWMLAPPIALVAAFFFIPAFYMLRMSFNVHPPGGTYQAAWTLENYIHLVTSEIYLRSLGQTVLLALGSSVVTVVAAYLFALRVWLSSGAVKLALLALALCPLLISEISVILGWWMFFPHNGLLSYSLVSMGVVHEKFTLMYTIGAAVVGLTYISLPYGIFILLSSFDSINRRVVEASGDLGASPFRTFREVLLPLTGNSIFAAFAQAFIWNIGTYATPAALGPDWLWTIGAQTYQQMVTWRNWPFASVLANVVMIIVLISLSAVRRLNRPAMSYHA